MQTIINALLDSFNDVMLFFVIFMFIVVFAIISEIVSPTKH
jgi:hypothetical protein